MKPLPKSNIKEKNLSPDPSISIFKPFGDADDGLN
jgi:hypothetical protein